MVAVIEDGGYARGMMDRMRELEARQDELNERLSTVPADMPDIHPKIADIYRRKVERLAEALADPRDRDEAAEAIRGLIERIVLIPGEKRGEMHAALHGDLGTILEWTGGGAGKRATDTPKTGMSVSVVAGARPGRGTGAPSQTSSMRTTSRISSRPPSSGKIEPTGKRTCTERPGCSILSISAPSSSRSPDRLAPLSRASRTSGAASRVIRPSITPARAQNGASGSFARGSSQASMPQRRAPVSAAVLSLTGNGARSGRPGVGLSRSHAARYALLARMKRQARAASHPLTRRAMCQVTLTSEH